MTTTQDRARIVRGNIVFVFVLAFALYLAWLVRDVLVLVYVSALFAVVLLPVVQATSRMQIGRWRPLAGSRAIFFLFMALATVLVVFCSLAFPPVIRDLQGFSGEMPTRLPALLLKLHQIPFADRINTADIISRMQDAAAQGAGYVLESARNWVGVLGRIVVCLVLTLYFLLEGDQAYRWTLAFFPVDRRRRLDAALQRAAVRMGNWLLGQASLMLVLGLTSTIVFLSLHLRYAYALGFLTGLLNIVPVLGAAISLVLAVLVASIDSWGRVLGVVIFFVVYLSVENYFLIPQIMKNRVNLPALGIFVALLLGSALEGVVGAMVAIPTAVLVSVLLNEYFARKEEA
ncbi:MAG: AI-2E family transporter [Terracidiphilus sp.]|jgi:predicted PurR-regulated permease PerM